MYQQPPNQPQQNTYYPPQPPFQQPPGYPPQPQGQWPQQPKKKRKKWPIILLVLALIVAVIVLASSLSNQGSTTTSTTNTTTTATQAATGHQATWKTTHTFTGNGSKKTETIAVGDDWKINWKCDHASFQGLDYNVIITVYNSDGTIADSGVNATCQKGSTSGTTEIHTSGNVYLDVVSEGSWSIQVQELK